MLGNSGCGHSSWISRIENIGQHLDRRKFGLWTQQLIFRKINAYIVFCVLGLHCIYCMAMYAVLFLKGSVSDLFLHAWDFGKSRFDGADPRTPWDSHCDRWLSRHSWIVGRHDCHRHKHTALSPPLSLTLSSLRPPVGPEGADAVGPYRRCPAPQSVAGIVQHLPSCTTPVGTRARVTPHCMTVSVWCVTVFAWARAYVVFRWSEE